MLWVSGLSLSDKEGRSGWRYERKCAMRKKSKKRQSGKSNSSICSIDKRRTFEKLRKGYNSLAKACKKLLRKIEIVERVSDEQLGWKNPLLDAIIDMASVADAVSEMGTNPKEQNR
jgi:hypothetical protein